MTVYRRDIEAAEAEVKQRVRLYLQRFGWKSTCSTPGAYWLWQRDFKEEDADMERIHAERQLPSPHVPYGVLTVPEDIALGMTEAILDERTEDEE